MQIDWRTRSRGAHAVRAAAPFLSRYRRRSTCSCSPVFARENLAKDISIVANTHVYSIWLQPTGEVRETLAGIISRLSREYATPTFEPHVTLIGELTGQEQELLTQTELLAHRLRPFVVQLGDIGYQDEFYRCLYIHVQQTEPVMAANGQARQVFHRETDPAYMPHLSLVYANMPPTVKKEIVDQIGKNFRRNFPVDRLYLVSTQGETKEWYHLGEFAL